MKPHPILRKTRRALRRICDVVPPTWRGGILAVVSGLSLWFYGFNDLDLVLYVIGISGIALLVLASMASGGAALWLRRHLPAASGGGRRIEAGSPIRTGWEVPALGRLPLVKIRWEWLTPGGVDIRIRPHGKVLREEVFARGRGHARQIRRRVTVEDAFGLTRLAWTDADADEVTILPHRGQLRSMPVVQSMTAADGTPHPSGAPEGDRMDIRRYAPGDSVRNILWKTYARTRQLNVRIPETSIERSKKTIAYLLAGEGDEAAAAAARVALEAGALGDQWVFGADGTDEPTENLDEALQAIARSGSFFDHGEAPPSGLGAFLRQVGQQGEVHCIVFASSRPGEWTPDVLEAARNYPGAMTFVLGTDGVLRNSPKPLWRRLLLAEGPPHGTPLDELGALLRQLGGAGCPALVIDRPSGRAYNQAQQSALGASG